MHHRHEEGPEGLQQFEGAVLEGKWDSMDLPELLGGVLNYEIVKTVRVCGTSERHFTINHREKSHPQSKHIHLQSIIALLAVFCHLPDLGTHVTLTPSNLFESFHLTLNSAKRGKSKITQFGTEFPPFLKNENIVQFNIPMSYRLLMGMLQSFDYVSKERGGSVQFERLLLDEVKQGSLVGKLDDQNRLWMSQLINLSVTHRTPNLFKLEGLKDMGVSQHFKHLVLIFQQLALFCIY